MVKSTDDCHLVRDRGEKNLEYIKLTPAEFGLLKKYLGYLHKFQAKLAEELGVERKPE